MVGICSARRPSSGELRQRRPRLYHALDPTDGHRKGSRKQRVASCLRASVQGLAWPPVIYSLKQTYTSASFPAAPSASIQTTHKQIPSKQIKHYFHLTSIQCFKSNSTQCQLPHISVSMKFNNPSPEYIHMRCSHTASQRSHTAKRSSSCLAGWVETLSAAAADQATTC